MLGKEGGRFFTAGGYLGLPSLSASPSSSSTWRRRRRWKRHRGLGRCRAHQFCGGGGMRSTNASFQIFSKAILVFLCVAMLESNYEKEEHKVQMKKRNLVNQDDYKFQRMICVPTQRPEHNLYPGLLLFFAAFLKPCSDEQLCGSQSGRAESRNYEFSPDSALLPANCIPRCNGVHHHFHRHHSLLSQSLLW